MSYQDALIKELQYQGITHPAVLNAIKQVPRDKFVLTPYKNRAYDNTALPIESHQTISQPYIVALMTQALFQHPNPTKILEIGTGSGYQAAILATIFKEIWTIERIAMLYEKAKQTLAKLHYHNIHCKLGDGALGWPEEAPFDGILVTAAASSIPHALVEQLNQDNGVLVIPVGRNHQVQKLTVIKRKKEKFSESIIELVSFVPLLEGTEDLQT